MTKMNWDKARRDRLPREFKSRTTEKQKNLTKFVRKHNLSCFRCKTKTGPWGRIGTNKFGPWALCEDCRVAYHSEKERLDEGWASERSP